MKLSDNIKPISYLKANAAEVVKSLEATREPLVITQNGEARMVVQDIRSFEEAQDRLALLKLLALGTNDIAAGRHEDAFAVLDQIEADIKA